MGKKPKADQEGNVKCFSCKFQQDAKSGNFDLGSGRPILDTSRINNAGRVVTKRQWHCDRCWEKSSQALGFVYPHDVLRDAHDPKCSIVQSSSQIDIAAERSEINSTTQEATTEQHSLLRIAETYKQHWLNLLHWERHWELQHATLRLQPSSQDISTIYVTAHPSTKSYLGRPYYTCHFADNVSIPQTQDDVYKFEHGDEVYITSAKLPSHRIAELIIDAVEREIATTRGQGSSTMEEPSEVFVGEVLYSTVSEIVLALDRKLPSTGTQWRIDKGTNKIVFNRSQNAILKFVARSDSKYADPIVQLRELLLRSHHSVSDLQDSHLYSCLNRNIWDLTAPSTCEITLNES